MTFREFMFSWINGHLHTDVTWRGYSIPAYVATHPRRLLRIREALKALGLRYAGEFAIPEFMARYGVPGPEAAERLLAEWRVWWLVSNGRRVNGLQKRSDAGVAEGA